MKLVKLVSFFTFEIVSRGGRKRSYQLDSKFLLVGVHAFLFSVFQLVQWNNMKEYVLDTNSDLFGKVEKRARKPWITQEKISKMDERRKWNNVNTEEGRKSCRRLRNELKRATEKAKKEYLGKDVRTLPEAGIDSDHRDYRISQNRPL